MLSLIALAACTLLRRATRVNWTGPLTAGDRHTCQAHDPVLMAYCARPAHHPGPHDDTLGCIWTPHGPRTIALNSTGRGRITIHGEPA